MVEAQIVEICVVFPSLLHLCLLFSLLWWVSNVLLLLFSLSLGSFTLVILYPPLPSPHLHVGGVQCQETREVDLEPRVKAHLKSNGAIFSAACNERGRRCWNRKTAMRREREMAVCAWRRALLSFHCFKDNIFSMCLCVRGQSWSLLVCNYSEIILKCLAPL